MTEKSSSETPRRHDNRTVLSASEARQGEIVLGKYGRWIWIGTFAVVLLILIFGWQW